MSPPVKKYYKKIDFSVTPDELRGLKDAQLQSVCRSLSSYIRMVLFKKEITIRTRNQSFDDLIEEWIAVRNELQQLRDRLPFSPAGEARLLELITQIKSGIHQLVDLCMQK
jgi:hypothetical protein